MSINMRFVGPYAILILNRPETHNALNHRMIEAISYALDQVPTSGARALIVTGAGAKSFCAGADIKELMDRSPIERRLGTQLGQRAFDKIAKLPIPSVAVIQGYALGGGLELAMACTFRIATRCARLGLPEIKLGLIPGYGGTQRLPRLVGEARALEILMSGRAIEATEAERWGLVNLVVADGDPVELGRTFMFALLGNSQCVSQFGRDAVIRGMATTLTGGLDIETDLSTLTYQTEDVVKEMRAFIQRRTSQFNGA